MARPNARSSSCVFAPGTRIRMAWEWRRKVRKGNGADLDAAMPYLKPLPGLIDIIPDPR